MRSSKLETTTPDILHRQPSNFTAWKGARLSFDSHVLLPFLFQKELCARASVRLLSTSPFDPGACDAASGGALPAFLVAPAPLGRHVTGRETRKRLDGRISVSLATVARKGGEGARGGLVPSLVAEAARLLSEGWDRVGPSGAATAMSGAAAGGEGRSGGDSPAGRWAGWKLLALGLLSASSVLVAAPASQAMSKEEKRRLG